MSFSSLKTAFETCQTDKKMGLECRRVYLYYLFTITPGVPGEKIKDLEFEDKMRG